MGSNPLGAWPRTQALHSTRVRRPQAGPSDEEAGWARGLAGQTADPLPERTPSLGNSLEGGAAAWEVRAPALGTPIQPGPRRVLGCLLRATQHLLHPPQPIKNVPAVGGVKIEADTLAGEEGAPDSSDAAPSLGLLCYSHTWSGALRHGPVRPHAPGHRARPMGCQARSNVTITRGRAAGGQCLSRSCPQRAPARLSRPSRRSVEPRAAPGLGRPAVCWRPGVPGHGHHAFQPLHSKHSISETPGSHPGVSRVWDVGTVGSHSLNTGCRRSCFIPKHRIWGGPRGRKKGDPWKAQGAVPRQTARES